MIGLPDSLRIKGHCQTKWATEQNAEVCHVFKLVCHETLCHFTPDWSDTGPVLGAQTGGCGPEVTIEGTSGCAPEVTMPMFLPEVPFGKLMMS